MCSFIDQKYKTSVVFNTATQLWSDANNCGELNTGLEDKFVFIC